MFALRKIAISFSRRISEIYEKLSSARLLTNNSSEVQYVTSAIRSRISAIQDSPTSRIDRISRRLNISPRIPDINRAKKRISWFTTRLDRLCRNVTGAGFSVPLWLVLLRNFLATERLCTKNQCVEIPACWGFAQKLGTYGWEVGLRSSRLDV